MKSVNKLSTGEIAERLGVTPHTIRNWHKSGKLVPEYVDPDTNHRYYTEDQVYEYNKRLRKKAYKYDMLNLVAYVKDIPDSSAKEQREIITKYLHNRGMKTECIQEMHKTYLNSELKGIMQQVLDDDVENIVVTTEQVFFEGTKEVIKHILEHKDVNIIIAE